MRIKPLAAAVGLSLCTVFNAQATNITFMHFNDLHAHMTTHLDKVVKNGQVVYEQRGGIARLATKVKQIRAENPNSVLMNVGDTYHGGAEAMFTKGNAVVDPVNALGIDVGVPGNWDFAYSPMVTQLRYTQMSLMQKLAAERMVGTILRPSFPNLGGNVTYSMLPGKIGQPIMPATYTKTVGGVKLGFIGITSDMVPEMSPMLAMGFSFLQGETAHRDYVNKHAAALRAAGAKVVVVMSELGLHKDYRLADVVKAGAVDVFFSAHTHEHVFTPLKSKSGALVVESGNDSWLGRMDVNVVAGQPNTFKWQLLPINTAIPENATVKAKVDAARKPFLAANPNLTTTMMSVTNKLNLPLNRVVGHVHTPLDRQHALESSFANAWTDTLRAKFGTDAAMTLGFRMDAPVAASGTLYEGNYIADGAITVEDVYRFFPMPFNLSSGTVAVKRMKAILEEGLTASYSLNSFAQHGGWTDGISGLNVTMDLSKPDGSRIRSLARADGSALADTDTLTVAGCTRPIDLPGTLCSRTGFSNVTALTNPATGAAWVSQDLLIAALSQGWFKNDVRKNKFDLANTPSWPSQPFVQPLAVRATTGVSVTKSALSYNASTGQYTGTLTLTNTGASRMSAPLKIVLDGLSTAITVVNAGGKYYGQSYLVVPGALNAGASVNVPVILKNPSAAAVNYTPSVLSGGV